MRSGRPCQLLDGAFRHHEFSSSAAVLSHQRDQVVQPSSEVIYQNGSANSALQGNAPSSGAVGAPPSGNPPENATGLPDTPSQADSRTADPIVSGSSPLGLPDAEPSSARPPPNINADALSPGFTPAASSIGTHTVPKGIPEHCEEAFFLRIFCEGPARW